MSDLDAVSGPGRMIETPAPDATPPPAAGPAIDTAPATVAAPPPESVAPLPAGRQPIDYGLAGAGMQSISDNVGVDFGHIAALMMQIDSEIARATRDAEVAQIDSVAREMHASADDIRKSAKLALAGGVVSGATQIASAGISIGGGIQGMRLTSNSAAMEPTVDAPAASAPGTTPAETVSDTATPPPSGTPGEETAADTVEEDSAQRKVAARRLDHTRSQQLSARSQNVALMTEGLSKLSTATGEMIKSALDYESRQTDAASKDAEARAEEQRAYLDRTKGFADSMQKGAQDMLQIFQQMDESLHQTNKAVWSRA